MLATMIVPTNERKVKRRKALSQKDRLHIARVAECHLLCGKSIRKTAELFGLSVGKTHRWVALAMTFPECRHLVKLAADRAKVRPVPKGLRRP